GGDEARRHTASCRDRNHQDRRIISSVGRRRSPGGDRVIAAPSRDPEIQAEANRALANVAGSPVADPALRVSVLDGIVTVSGSTATASAAANICARLRQVPGVVGVIDRIVDDDSLQRLVKPAILEHPRAANIRKSHVVMGTIYLDWDMRDPDGEHGVREVLLRVPGVRAVIHGSWSRSQEAEQALRRLGPATKG